MMSQRVERDQATNIFNYKKGFFFFFNTEKTMKGCLDVDVNVACAVFSEV